MSRDEDRKYYDEAFVEIFSNRKIVQSLLEDFIKEKWVNLIDFFSMKSIKSVFKGINDSKKESDLLLKFNHKDQKDRNLYIFILIEFQSTAKPMNLRILEYLLRIYKKQKREHKKLFPVIPIVIYNGNDKWREKTNFTAQFNELPDGIVKYIPDFNYILIDIARFDDKLLENIKDAVSYFFILDKTDLREKERAALRITGLLRGLRESDPEIFSLLGRYIEGLLKYKGVEINTINEYISDRGESMLAQSMDELIEEGRVEGREEEKLLLVNKMLAEGLDVKMISHITGLEISEIEKLKTNNIKNED